MNQGKVRDENTGVIPDIYALDDSCGIHITKIATAEG